MVPTGLATFVVENVVIVEFGISGINGGVGRMGSVEETSESRSVKQAQFGFQRRLVSGDGKYNQVSSSACIWLTTYNFPPFMLSHFPCVYLIGLIHRTCICGALISLSVNFSAGDVIYLPTQQSAFLCPRRTVTFTSKKLFMSPAHKEDRGVATKKRSGNPDSATQRRPGKTQISLCLGQASPG